MKKFPTQLLAAGFLACALSPAFAGDAKVIVSVKPQTDEKCYQLQASKICVKQHDPIGTAYTFNKGAPDEKWHFANLNELDGLAVTPDTVGDLRLDKADDFEHVLWIIRKNKPEKKAENSPALKSLQNG